MQKLEYHDSQLVNATETISTVAHCLREMIENSIDAGSTILNIKLTGTGLDSIIISDNGCGISKEGLELLCTEGATSKKFGSNICGGRGKALDAISKLSIFTVESCCDNSQHGFRLSFLESGERSISPASRAKGTCFTIQSLFYNYPVRRRYSIENKQKTIKEIQEVCAAFALATNVSITVLLDNKNIVQVSNCNRQNRIKAILGPSIAQGLITGKEKLDAWSEGSWVEYYSSSPTTATKGKIIISINDRPAVNMNIVSALKQEFKLCAGPKIPTIILYINSNRENFDFTPNFPLISVSFSNEYKLQRLLCSVMSNAWKTTSETLTFKDNKGSADINIEPQSSPLTNSIKIKPARSATIYNKTIKSNTTTDNILQRLERAVQYKEYFGPSHNIIDTEAFDNMEIIGQWNKAFLITRLGSDIYAIDQHAACEAQNFEKLRKQQTNRKQRLLEPIVLKATPDDLENAINYRDRCKEFGFEYDVKDDGIHVYTIPNDKNIVDNHLDLQELLGMIHDVPDSTPMTHNARIQLAFHACHSSVRVGDSMSHIQIKKLLSRMAHSDYPWNCPHGRPTWCCIHILESEISFSEPPSESQSDCGFVIIDNDHREEIPV